MPPLLILFLGIAVVLGGIIVLRVNAFLALMVAAILVSLLAPGEAAVKIVRVAEAFGRTAGNVGIVIALAAIIGKAMADSGAADRVVRAFLALLGEKRGGTAMTASGFVLSVPVFFDTVFFLLVPLARSLFTRTKRDYLKYLTAIAAGGVATHALVPPTPGPLAAAATLGVDLGLMMLVAIVVAAPSATAGLIFAGWINRHMPVPFRPLVGEDETQAPASDDALPRLGAALLPILLPVLLISSNTIVNALSGESWAQQAGVPELVPYTAVLGNPNLALMLSAAIAVWVYAKQRQPSRTQIEGMVESALMSAGIIILITAAGGAFGAMLQAAEIGPAIQGLFAVERGGSGIFYILMGFAVASLLKFAQGSSTVAIITTAAMVGAMIGDLGTLDVNPVYLATAIGGGGLVGSWMNDSGFWVFTKMGGLTEAESLRSWTPLLAIVGTTAMLTTLLLALVFPLV
jgi:gluconate:H+ symporter, GntP family